MTARLDYARIKAGTTAIAGEFAAILATANPVDHDQCLVAPDDVIRHDCELLFDWWRAHLKIAGWFSEPIARDVVLTFVIKRRGLLEWPAWANDWCENAGA